MAAVACDLITTRLIGPRDILDRLDPDKVAAELEAPLLSTVDEITREVMAEFQPGLWETLPESSRLLLIRRIQAERGLSIIFISHDLGLVRYLTSTVLVMKDGFVVEQGKTDQVLSQPTHPYTQRLIASALA